MTPEEKRSYSKGYAVGRRKVKTEDAYRREQLARQAFLDKAFLAALPIAMQLQGWKFGDAPITNTEDRTRLAWSFAKEALRQRPYAA